MLVSGRFGCEGGGSSHQNNPSKLDVYSNYNHLLNNIAPIIDKYDIVAYNLLKRLYSAEAEVHDLLLNL